MLKKLISLTLGYKRSVRQSIINSINLPSKSILWHHLAKHKLSCFWTFGIVLGWSLLTLICFWLFLHYGHRVYSREELMQFIIRSIDTKENYGSCQFPDLPIDYDEITRYHKNVQEISCEHQSSPWVVCEQSKCVIQEFAKQKFGVVACTFRELKRNTDDATVGFYKPSSTSEYQLQHSDFVEVKCRGNEDKRWHGVLAGFKELENISPPNGSNKTQHPMTNVLIFGIGSLSRIDFTRKLPKSYKYLTEVLGAQTLKGYNSLGDTKASSLIPLLTGMMELELPETRKRIKGAERVDIFPFIWKEYKSFDYVTAFGEDIPAYGTFNYRLNGFELSPADHYLNPFYIKCEAFRPQYGNLCLGSTPRHKVMLDYIKNYVNAYQHNPKFSFTFLNALSDGYTSFISGIDGDMLIWLTDLKKMNVLDNTVLIIMSESGNQFDSIRKTYQGRFEQRLPFFSLIFPKWFEEQFPESFGNVQENVDRLTTPFDIYETLHDILQKQINNKTIFSSPIKYQHRKSRHGISLFQKISPTRSCAEAEIQEQWCGCLSWKDCDIKKNSRAKIEKLADIAISKINNATKAYRNLCAKLELQKIISARVLAPREALLKYEKSEDIDGFRAVFTDNVQISRESYQLKMLLKPFHAILLAELTYDLHSDLVDVNVKDVQRENDAGSWTKCLPDGIGNEELKIICFC